MSVSREEWGLVAELQKELLELVGPHKDAVHAVTRRTLTKKRDGLRIWRAEPQRTTFATRTDAEYAVQLNEQKERGGDGSYWKIWNAPRNRHVSRGAIAYRAADVGEKCRAIWPGRHGQPYSREPSRKEK